MEPASEDSSTEECYDEEEEGEKVQKKPRDLGYSRHIL